MSREKSEKDVRSVPITVRLNEEEHEKLKQCAACGLSAAEFMRQLCKGNAPQPQPKTEFWALLNTLFESVMHLIELVQQLPKLGFGLWLRGVSLT